MNSSEATAIRPKLTITRGLPGSGKSTWAESFDAVLISRDEIRLEVFGVKRGPKPGEDVGDQEALLSAIVRERVSGLLNSGQDVVLDSMNAEDSFVADWMLLAAELHATSQVVTFAEDLAVLLQRNSERPDETRVDEHELRELARRYPFLIRD